MVRYRRKPTTGPVFIAIVTAERRRWPAEPEALRAFRDAWEPNLKDWGGVPAIRVAGDWEDE